MKMEVDGGLLKSLLVLGAVIESRDAYTGGHTWRVAQFSKILATRAGLSEEAIFAAGLGGFLHDIGKIGVSDSILAKPSSLTVPEYKIIRTHPEVGKALLIDHPLAGLILDAVSHHHERHDGRGYPEGLSGEELTPFAKITTIADAFDAMTSVRPYRPPRGLEEALAELNRRSGTQFDPELVKIFQELAITGHLAHIIGHSDLGRPMVDCPVCGPIIAVPRNKKNGDTIHCNSCKGTFELHIKEDTFEAEFKNEKNPDIQPEIDGELIAEIVDQASDKTKREVSAS